MNKQIIMAEDDFNSEINKARKDGAFKENQVLAEQFQKILFPNEEFPDNENDLRSLWNRIFGVAKETRKK